MMASGAFYIWEAWIGTKHKHYQSIEDARARVAAAFRLQTLPRPDIQRRDGDGIVYREAWNLSTLISGGFSGCGAFVDRQLVG